jgi:hypothetical protein
VGGGGGGSDTPFINAKSHVAANISHIILSALLACAVVCVLFTFYKVLNFTKMLGKYPNNIYFSPALKDLYSALLLVFL